MAINLLPSNLQSAQKVRSLRVVLNAVSVGMLVLLSATVMILFSYRVVVTKEFNEIEANVKDVSTQVVQKQSLEWYLASVQSKVEGVNAFTETQYPCGDVLEELQILAGEAVGIDSVAIDDKQNISVGGHVSRLVDLAGYVKILDQEDLPYKNIYIGELRFNENDFSYWFEFSFVYSTKTPTSDTVSPAEDIGI